MRRVVLPVAALVGAALLLLRLDHLWPLLATRTELTLSPYEQHLLDEAGLAPADASTSIALAVDEAALDGLSRRLGNQYVRAVATDLPLAYTQRLLRPRAGARVEENIDKRI